ncbi:MAG: 2-oxoacid:acceptor oxidoreductase family protein [Deltaproteobacteria bacterium]|nr:2-oxoacid:acceptor oxidoreductase family protein [Deltaproteobacteria bacterium]MBW2218860.1 2-oxoacid:acceptor oxidoreductase family protein [Deltaproteobacteria bacterium]
MRDDIIEIRWHGRGGQGAITAAKIVANTAFFSGYSGVVMTPTFGTERRGAPVFTSLKISKNKIYDLSPIVSPDMVIVLDHQLLEEANVISGLKPGGLVVLNTSMTPDAFNLGNAKTATADITSLAIKTGLKPGIVNSGIIGAFAKASGLLDINLLADEIRKEFKGKKPDENAEAAKIAFSSTIVGE